MSPRPEYSLGARLSPQDSRDFKSSFYRLQQVIEPVFEIDTECISPVRNQGQEGTCVGHAAVNGLLEYFVNKLSLSRTLSVRDAYEGGRSCEISPPSSDREGTYPRAVLKYLQKFGVCLEEDWPYTSGSAGTEFASAKKNRPLNKAFSYASVNTRIMADIKGALMTNGPLLICVPVYDEFYDPNPDTGKISMPKDLFVASDGLHAITLVGWNNSKQSWKIKNSWGTEWGNNGFAWLPYSYPIVEAWTIVPAILDKLDIQTPIENNKWPKWLQWLLSWLGIELK